MTCYKYGNITCIPNLLTVSCIVGLYLNYSTAQIDLTLFYSVAISFSTIYNNEHMNEFDHNSNTNQLMSSVPMTEFQGLGFPNFARKSRLLVWSTNYPTKTKKANRGQSLCTQTWLIMNSLMTSIHIITAKAVTI